MESLYFDKMDELIQASLRELSVPPQGGNPTFNPTTSATKKRQYRKQGLDTKKSVCQIIGCEHSLLTAYAKKYRVCNAHVKCAEVCIHGDIQRFCQKCSRFHPIADFDGYRRTCRVRLAQHNTRRRLIRAMQRADREISTNNPSSGEDYPSRHNVYRPRGGVRQFTPPQHQHQHHPLLQSAPAPVQIPSRAATGNGGDMHAALLQIALARLGPDSSNSPGERLDDINQPAVYDPDASFSMPPSAAAHPFVPAMYRPGPSPPQQLLQHLSLPPNSPEAALLNSVDPQQLVRVLQLILSLQQMGLCSLDQLEHPDVLPLMMSLLQTA